VIPPWYHYGMAMTLRLTDEQSDKLRKAAEQDGLSMHEAAVRAIESYTSRRATLLSDAITRVAKEDAELLDRLSK